MMFGFGCHTPVEPNNIRQVDRAGMEIRLENKLKISVNKFVYNKNSCIFVVNIKNN